MSLDFYPDNLAHLQGALLVLNLRLQRHLLRRRAGHQVTADELLGLYVSDQEVDELLDGLYAAGAPPDADEVDQAPIATLSALLVEAASRHHAREAAALAAGVGLRLPQAAERLGLGAFERDVVLLALAPEMDRRYERLFGYLNNDVTQRWPTAGLALDLFGGDLAERVRWRRAFDPEAPLCRLRIVHIGEDKGPLAPSLLARSLKLDDRMAGFVLDSGGRDQALRGLLRPIEVERLPVLDANAAQEVAVVVDHLARAASLAVALTGPDTGLLLAGAVQLAAGGGPRPLLALAGASVAAHSAPDDVCGRALREALLAGAALAVHDVHLLPRGSAAAVALDRLVDQASGVPLFLLAAQPWITPASCLTLDLPAPDAPARERLWAAALDGHATGVDLAELADRFRFGSDQIAAAAARARLQAGLRGDGRGVARADLIASCRTQSILALDGLAERVESIHTWEDLILPPAIKAQLLSLEHWVRYRHVVYGAWGFSRRVMLGRGLAALFVGPSGTGKTMAAGILARALELDLYRIDLSTMVSKYIGETEKNLSRIFAAAEAGQAILFFDEADALFGKRSEVKDAHDRYANIEVSYLLQRMEAYDGVAILATNFRQNLDHAFVRRMHVTIEFPFPQAPDRERIWRRLLPEIVPKAPDVDLAYLARQFSLAGGNVKNCALTAAFAAAAEGGPLQMRHLVQAVAREYEKLDQPILPNDFEPYVHLIRPQARSGRGGS